MLAATLDPKKKKTSSLAHGGGFEDPVPAFGEELVKLIYASGNAKGAGEALHDLKLSDGRTVKEQLDELVERAGRSAPGRRVVEYMAGLGHPATVKQVLAVTVRTPYPACIIMRRIVGKAGSH